MTAPTPNQAPLLPPQEFYLGIDPGFDGAVAFYNPVDGALVVVDMPTHDIVRNKKQRRALDIYGLGLLMDRWRPLVRAAVIEQVNAMPDQGIASAFVFGENYGTVKALVAGNLIPMHLSPASEWKKQMRLPSGLSKPALKDASRALASKLLPRHADKWPLKKHDGRAEAALLAWYAANKVQW